MQMESQAIQETVSRTRDTSRELGERFTSLELQEKDLKNQLRDIGRVISEEYKKVQSDFEQKYLSQ